MSESKDKSILTLLATFALGAASTLGLMWIKRKIFPNNPHITTKQSESIIDKYNQLIEIYKNQELHLATLQDCKYIIKSAMYEVSLNTAEIKSVINCENITDIIKKKIDALSKINRLALLNLHQIIEEFEKKPNSFTLTEDEKINLIADFREIKARVINFLFKGTTQIMKEVDPKYSSNDLLRDSSLTSAAYNFISKDYRSNEAKVEALSKVLSSIKKYAGLTLSNAESQVDGVYDKRLNIEYANNYVHSVEPSAPELTEVPEGIPVAQEVNGDNSWKQREQQRNDNRDQVSKGRSP